MIITNFPSGFTPNKSQIYVAEQLEEFSNSGKKYCIINAPTGAGKSMVAKMLTNATKKISKEKIEAIDGNLVFSEKAVTEKLSHLDGDNTPREGGYILTVTKALQDQYEKQFKDARMLKGKKSYRCTVDTDKTPEDA